ncbi:unnamed protein product [Trifolium pratense]|uniref:Uncharacterized protein n=1 Tax=Trifolium pratense TaxID=57577 RepID=A0ACB0J357_TRIPR|nr:unnamed protein product [Trifolium pratense]
MVCEDNKGNNAVFCPLLTDETIAGTLASSRSLPTLPFDLIVEILCRLTVKFLLQFRCVCKSWKSLISSPKFVKKHLRLSTTRLVHTLTSSTNQSHNYILNSIFNDVSPNVALLKYHSKHLDHFIGSCNGILCLADIYDGLFRLWNPSIRKFKELPHLKKHDYENHNMMMYGFGHDPVLDNYKVVVVLRSHGHLVTKKTYGKVYTLGTNFWKNIEEFPFGCVVVQQRSGTFVSGTINWLVSRMYPTRRQHFIASFDLRNESYQEVFLPDCRVVDVYNLRLGALGVLRDCLCLVFRNDVWVMKEYGNHESWTKLFAITYMQDLPISYANIKVLNIFGDNQVLLKSTEWTDKLIVYNFKNGTYKYTKFGNSAEVCGESLISSCF